MRSENNVGKKQMRWKLASPTFPSNGGIGVADDSACSSTFNDAQGPMMLLARARRDLRELWLERNELATLAGQAMQV